MYKMKADGVVFYDPSADDLSLQVMSPKASYALNSAGSLEFTLLPGNVAYDSIEKMKTIVTLEQDGEVIFRGRVLETKKDTYNQQEVYCEGELAYLLDSLIRPYEYKGNAAELFRVLLSKHNEQVEEYKRFEPGIITAVKDTDSEEIDGGAYTDALSEIKNLLVDVYGGYLRVRHADGVRYLDYVDAFEQTCTQEITFGVNIVDIESTVNAQEICTVLVPLGKDYLTIADVNDRKDYIEDADLIAKYGRIVKTVQWDDVSDPLDLKRLGQEYMKLMNADTTLTINAVDMHVAGADVDAIHLGDTVKLNSAPHGIAKEDVCTSVELDIENPEKSEYTFGIPRESLTKAQANSFRIVRNALMHQHKWLTETETALNINVEAVNLIGHRTTQLEIDVDAAEEAITLKASQESLDVLEDAHKAALLRLDAAEAAILLKASKETVEELGNRLSHAEINIDGANAAIALKANQTTVDEQGKLLSTVQADLDAAEAAILLKASTSQLDALGNRVTDAEAAITVNADAIAARVKQDDYNTYVSQTAQQIALKASQGDLDAAVLRLDAAEGSITAQAKTIETKANTVRVEALETEVKGLLKVENLQAAISDLQEVAASTLSVSGRMDCTNFYSHGAGSVDGDLTVTGDLSVGGETAATQKWVEEQKYLTAVPSTYATQSWVIDKGYATSSDVALTLGGYVMTSELSNYPNNTHSHSVTVNDDGTITLGEVATTGGSFRIADTAYYKDGVSAAKASVTLSSAGWVNGSNVVSASNGKSVTVNLPAFSVSGGDSFNASHQTVVFFHTASVSGYLSSKTVDASSVYDEGYAAGYQAAKDAYYDSRYQDGYEDGVLVGHENGYSEGYQAAKDAVKVEGGISSITNPAQGYYMAKGWAAAKLDGEQIDYTIFSKSQSFG